MPPTYSELWTAIFYFTASVMIDGVGHLTTLVEEYYHIQRDFLHDIGYTWVIENIFMNILEDFAF
jgi:hypothetical protein